MSYADLKPVRFEDGFDSMGSNSYYSPTTPHHVPNQQQYQYIDVPTAETMFYSNNVYSTPQQQQQQHQQQPQYQYLQSTQNITHFHEEERKYQEIHNHQHQISQEHTTSQPIMTITPMQKRTNAKPISSSTPSHFEDSDLSEECQNHWMPMTWIERSADDESIFNFVCLWGKCVDVFTTKERLVEHIQCHIEGVAMEQSEGANYDTMFHCRVRGCSKPLPAFEELQRHMTMHIFQADCQQKGSEALVEKEEYSVIECCGFDPVINVHYEGEVLVCQWDNCGIPFTSLTDLFDHTGQHIDMMGDVDKVDQLTENGDRKTVYPCHWSGCSQFSDSRANLRRHIRHHSGEKVLACPFCAKFFSRKDKLFDHCIRRTILMNEIEDPYICKLCQKKFGTEKALCMHVTRHLVAHNCPLCGLAVANRGDLHRHLMSKHSSRTKDHKCDTCSKKFFSESELTRHQIIHTDVMYNCKHCPEKFKWKKQLLKHLKEHEENFNPTPYICHVCEKCYTTGFTLGRHLSRAHNCQIPYGFSRFTYKKCADGLMRLQTKRLFRTEES